MAHKDRPASMWLIAAMLGLLAGLAVWAARRERVRWVNDPSAGGQAGRPTFMYFTDSSDGPCQSINAQTWADGRVADALKGYSAVKLNVDQRPDLSAKYDVHAVPCFVVVGPDGKVDKQTVGYLDADEFVTWLNG